MRPYDARLSSLLAALPIKLHPESYALLHLPRDSYPVALEMLAATDAPYAQLIAEPDGITLLLPAHIILAHLPECAQAHSPLRLITFDADLPPDLVGLLAMLTAALAAAQVSVLAICSFHRDALLVPEADAERARATLERFHHGGQDV